MITRFYKRLTRTKFEDIVLSRYQNVSKRLHKDEVAEFEFINLTLYYSNGVHIGTWGKSSAWLDVA